jgi:UDP-N-acetylmuramate-alanine ligase
MDALERAGARLHIGHSSSHLQGKSKQSSLPKAVVVSSAIPTDNEEITFAHSLGIPMLVLLCLTFHISLETFI